MVCIQIIKNTKKIFIFKRSVDQITCGPLVFWETSLQSEHLTEVSSVMGLQDMVMAVGDHKTSGGYPGREGNVKRDGLGT